MHAATGAIRRAEYTPRAVAVNGEDPADYRRASYSGAALEKFSLKETKTTKVVKTKREEFGPGFYLYLGTRRGMALYAEHSFVNLIWGLEAFHRKKNVGGCRKAADDLEFRSDQRVERLRISACAGAGTGIAKDELLVE